jgi:hypothetical protein
MKRVNISNLIKKYTNRLYKEGMISCSFSVHDFRRYCIKKGLKECKNGEDILLLSRRFHKQINTTIGYL